MFQRLALPFAAGFAVGETCKIGGLSVSAKVGTPTSEPLAVPVRKGARLMGIGLSKAYELMKAGELETFTVGRSRLITPQAMQNFINKRQAEAGGRNEL
jgi:hypothetical protein